jgi:membrane-bound lytic murein transglycosylase B
MLGISAGAARAGGDSFLDWQEQFSAKARNAGIPQQVINAAFANIEPDDYIIELDHKQPEDKLSFSKYQANTVNTRRIAEGRELMESNRVLLNRISEQYQVEPNIIVALMGMETDYGTRTGDYLVIQSLATLAYNGRRRDLFERELMDALTILAQGKLQMYDLVGSWAGAMGNCQFMPSSYLKYAVDYDGDGKADIWHSMPDTFASIANYLHQSGWQKGLGWGMRSVAPEAIYPGTPEEGGFLVTDNFNVIMKWNRSRYFATSVGLLSDQLQ